MRGRKLGAVEFCSFNESKDETRQPQIARCVPGLMRQQRDETNHFILPTEVHQVKDIELTSGATTAVSARMKSFLNRDFNTQSLSQIQHLLPNWIDALPASPSDILDALLECTVEGKARARVFALKEAVRFAIRHSLKDDRVMFRLLDAFSEDLRGVAIKELTGLLIKGAKGDARNVDVLLAGCSNNRHPNCKKVALAFLEEVMEAHLAKSGKIVRPALSGSRDGRQQMTKLRSRHLDYFEKEGPGRTYEIFTTLLETCMDRESSVRMQAMSHLTRLVELLREQRLEGAAVLVDGCRNQMDNEVILAALRCAMQSNTVWRENSDNMAALVSRLAEGTQFGIREEIVELAGKLIERSSLYSWDLATVVMEGSRRTGNANVQRAGVSYLAQAARACPARAEVILELLRERAHHSMLETTKESATRQLGVMIALWPEQFEEAVEDLLKAAANRYSGVRAAAMSHLGNLSKLYPERSREFLEIVLQGCNDACPAVRAAAVGQTATLANMCPECAEVLFEIALRGCRSPHPAIRESAQYDLGEIVDMLPTKAKQAAVAVFRGCADGQLGVSVAARKHLEKLLCACPDMAVAILAKAEESSSSESSNM